MYRDWNNRAFPYRCNCIVLRSEQQCPWRSGSPPTPPLRSDHQAQQVLHVWHSVTQSPRIPAVPAALWSVPAHFTTWSESQTWTQYTPSNSPISEPGSLYLADNQTRPPRVSNVITMLPAQPPPHSNEYTPPEHKIFVRNLPSNITIGDLRQRCEQMLAFDRLNPSMSRSSHPSLPSFPTYHFQPHPSTTSRIRNMELSRLRARQQSSRSRGGLIAVIEFHNDHDAAHALHILHGTFLSGQELSVEAYRPPPEARNRGRTGNGRGRRHDARRGSGRSAWRTPAVSVPEQRSGGGRSPSRALMPPPSTEGGQLEREEYQGPLIVDGRGTAGLGFCGLFDDDVDNE